ncbi:uncharacterized protein T551_01542 [Pneumocystis jirovecii RU7]|uniref:SH3 domain-containing protein n=1 Tax=Pneumocystis jirovecii (strain RU7) TaxID=1408657 RepID=A0A0W4ZRK8_PNEJ7|nr:uncharacterized protein T551_01542 [Pneumocystis jirovecii RU7]KTW30990.1 hypothetical protein T551_01542 [Pneumocystis jirovecii RU7]
MRMKKFSQIKAQLDISYLTDDLFILSTVILALIGWGTVVISSVIASLRAVYFPYYSWWIIVYQFFVIFCVIAIILSNSGDTYRIALVGHIAVVISCELMICNSLLYGFEPSQPIVVSGYIFLFIINAIWVLYFGTTNDSIFHSWTNSYILSESCKNTQNQFISRPALTKDIITNNENFNGSRSNDNQVSTCFSHNLQPLNSLNNTENSIMASNEYPHRAKAVYSCAFILKKIDISVIFLDNASPDDPREVSFVKDEILEIGDISGKWWQARKEDGTIGIVPSNYLQLITND